MWKNAISIKNNTGQSTVEYAIVLVSVLMIIAALSIMWHVISGDGFFQKVLSSLAHHIPGVIYEILLY